MAPSSSASRPARECRALLALLGALLACGGPSTDASTSSGNGQDTAADEIAFESVDEMQLELETLDNEIRGLEGLRKRPERAGGDRSVHDVLGLRRGWNDGGRGDGHGDGGGDYERLQHVLLLR